MTEKLTAEEQREVWEWTGLVEQETGSWYTDAGEYVSPVLPPITLDNLFLYAVPKLEKLGYWIQIQMFAGRTEVWISGQLELAAFSFVDKDPAIALFRPVQKVIRGG